MKIIYGYTDYLEDKEFEELFTILESSGKWTDENTYEWELPKVDKLKKFLSKLPKDRINKYFDKIVDKVKRLPNSRKIILGYAIVFSSFISISQLINLPEEVKTEIQELQELQRPSFEEAQKIVKQVEGGYSDDRKDTGNWIKVTNGKRFIGTKYGISAPVLADYLGKLPSKEDMMNLSYDTALDIYKTNYWDKYNLGEYSNQSISNIIYDGIVNQGQTGMRIVMRNAMNDNGISISKTQNPFKTEWIEKINDLDQEKLFNDIKKHRESRYREARTFKTHGKGWLKRINNLKFT